MIPACYDEYQRSKLETLRQLVIDAVSNSLPQTGQTVVIKKLVINVNYASGGGATVNVKG